MKSIGERAGGGGGGGGGGGILTVVDGKVQAALWQNSCQFARLVDYACCRPQYCYQSHSQYHDVELHFSVEEE